MEQIFHDHVGTYVQEIYCLLDPVSTEQNISNVRNIYIDRVNPRPLEKPILFIFNKIDDTTREGLHYSALLAGAGTAGVLWFEPARGGIQQHNRQMARRIMQQQEGIGDSRKREWL